MTGADFPLLQVEEKLGERRERGRNFLAKRNAFDSRNPIPTGRDSVTARQSEVFSTCNHYLLPGGIVLETVEFCVTYDGL